MPLKETYLQLPTLDFGQRPQELLKEEVNPPDIYDGGDFLYFGET